MTTTATANANEPLDLICYRVLGTTDGGVVEQAFNLNPGLADAGPFIAEGTQILLPDPPARATPLLETINLWD